MRVLPLLLAALLALAGVAAAGGGGGAAAAAGGRLSGILPIFGFGKRSRTLLQTSEPGGLTVTQVTSGASTIKLTVLQRKEPLPRKYYLVTYNNSTGQWVRNTVPWTSLNTVEQLNTPNATFNTYEVTLSSVPVGYHRVRVDVTMDLGGTLTDISQGTFPTSGGAAVGTPGVVTINGAAPVAGSKLQVTFTISSPVTAGKYRYKVYPYGTADHSSINPSDFVDITPWTTATYTFTTPTALTDGLYSVWVEVQHKDDATLSKTTDTDATSYAIGTPAKPTIVRVEEPTSTNNKFKVFFTLPQKNVQEIGYTLTNTATGLDGAPTCSPSPCQTIGGLKYKASFASVAGDADGAEYSLETDSAPANALYRIKLWAFNDADRATGTQSDPSKPAATYDTPGVPAEPAASETAADSKVLGVTFERASTAIASSYRYDVVDAAGGFAQYGSNVNMQNLLASIADVTAVNQGSLQFNTPAITSAEQRYKVVLRACTAKGCSDGVESDLAAIGQPTAPQTVHIASAGEDKLTVTWDAPLTDTPASYTVRLYSATEAFSGSVAAEWTGLSWNNQPMPSQGLLSIPGDEQTGYAFSTPALTLPLGFYKAEVLAVSTLYPAQSGDSSTDQAPLGYPGQIAIKEVVLAGGLQNPAVITFSESEPKTASSYAVTVQRKQSDDTWVDVYLGESIKYAVTPLDREDGDKEISIKTRSQPWPLGVAGQYRFIVHAGNEASDPGVYTRDSAASQPVLVGPPGNPSATAPDTVGPQLDITITRGTPNLNELFNVRIFKVNGITWPLDCDGATQVATTPDSDALSVTTNTLTDEKAIYCLQAVAVFEGSPYSSPSKSAPVFVGTPEKPNTPTVTSGVGKLTVQFNCPAIWNFRKMTYELNRVDMSSNTEVLSTTTTATNVSPRLVRAVDDTGLDASERRIVESGPVDARLCTFEIPTADIPSTANNKGQYQVRLMAHTDAPTSGSSPASDYSTTAYLGEPEPPTSVRVTNSATEDTKITIEMDKPAADVHGGFVLRLVWRRSGKADVDVTSTTSADGVNLYIDRGDVSNVNAPSDGKWTISFPIANMECGGASCNGKGRFKVVAFGALSRFDGNGNAVTDYKKGVEQLANTVPPDDIFYGNPGQPTGLAILKQPVRIYGPSDTNTLDLQFDVPDADVAAEYQYELYYFKSQGDTSDAVVVTDKAAWSDLDTATTDKFTLKIDLTKLDCNTAQAGVQGCTSGSYQLKSFKAITRVTTGGQDSTDATLPSPNNIIIVAASGSTPEAAKNVHVPDVKLATTPADTQVYIEVDLPTTDNIMGWVYNLQYIPYGDLTQAAAVTAGGSPDIYTQRYCDSGCATRVSSRLKIPLPKLGQLTCGGFGTCSSTAGGRFKLAQLKALSWFNTNSEAVVWDAGGQAAAALSAAASSYLEGSFGSPPVTGPWDTNFFVGSPSAEPSGFAVPDVQLASSNLEIFLSAPVADLAYSYVVTLKRTKANADTTEKTVTVEHSNRTPVAGNKFRLTIAPTSLAALIGDRAGRYTLLSVSAVSWFGTENDADRKTANGVGVGFTYGSPSDVDPFITGLAVPDVQAVSALKLQINPPDADVARYYSVEVDYYSGKAASKTLQLPAAAVTVDCTTTAKAALATESVNTGVGASLVVNCPTSCAANANSDRPVYTSDAGAYLFTSSICRAAIHAGVITDGAGGAVQLILGVGAASPRTWSSADAGNTGVTPGDPEQVDVADNWDMALGAPTKFIVQRSAATPQNGKLEMPVNLALAKCYKDENNQDVACNSGKYLVRSVTAHSWTVAGSQGVGAMTNFFFVGDPGAPTDVSGVSADEASASVQISFDRPEQDNAKEYIVELKQHFPGSRASWTCSSTFTMPTAGSSPDVVDAGTKRTITFSGLTGDDCADGLRGKFRVNSLTATSHSSGTTSSFTQGDTSPASYFYIGPVGPIDAVSSPNIAEANAGAVKSLVVHWQHDPVEDGHPTKQAKYTLKRYKTGASGEEICTDTPVGPLAMDSTAFIKDGSGADTTELELAVDVCEGKTLAKGRYEIAWSVIGNPVGNTESATSAFFYIGQPVAPGKPGLTNELASNPTPQRLKVTFTTPTTDNAEKYTYNLVKLDNPHEKPGDAAETDATGYTFVTVGENKDLDLPSGGTTLGPTDNTFYLTDLIDGLYRVRIRSHNPNGADALSAWSDVIGTGTTPLKPTIVSVSDGLNSLTVTFNLVSNAIMYKYTVYTEGTTAIPELTGVDLTTSSISWTGSTTGSFTIGPHEKLVAGRYKVAVAAINTDSSGADQTATGDLYLSSLAAVGMPSQPDTPTLTVPAKRVLQVTFAEPTVDSGLEYYYALYRADSGEGGTCYTTTGVKVDTAVNSGGFTVALPAGSLTDNPTGDSRTFQVNIPSDDENNNYNYDYKIRVGVKNSLVLQAGPEDQSNPQKKGGVAGITLCGTAGTAALDPSVYWSELSDINPIGVDDPSLPGKPTISYNYLGSTLEFTFTAPATARYYTYKVVDVLHSDREQLGMSTQSPISPTNLGGDDIPVSGISTADWPASQYQVIVYVQRGLATGEDQHTSSDPFYVGTPAPVTNVKLENSGAGKITVKYTPPPSPQTASIADIANLAGNYRYKLQSRLAANSWSNSDPNPVWVDLASKPTCADGECSFVISDLTDGLYKVEVVGRMLYGTDEAISTPVSSTTTGDHSVGGTIHMRSGIIGVGDPAPPQVTLTGGAGGITIGVTGSRDNALKYQWVYFKDADTASDDTNGLTALDLPFASVDPLTTQAAQSYQVDLNAELCGTDRDQACTAGTYRVGVAAVNGVGTSTYALTVLDPYSSIMGEPDVPAGVSVANSPSTQDKVTIQMTAPATDVHGGFVLQLKWLRGASPAVDVVSSTSADGTSLYVSRLNSDGSANTNVDTSTSGVWKISFPFSEMVCDTAAPFLDACTKGRFSVAAFGALSRFSSDGTLQPVTSFKSGKQIGTSAPLTSLPGGDIYYGNPDQPSDLTIANSPLRIYDPSALNTLNLQFSVPAADVAKEYAYELDYIPVQGVATTKTLSGKVDWSTVQTTSTGTALYTVKIDLTQLDCDLNTDLTQTCGTSIAGSYKLKSFKAITRVASSSGGQDSKEASLTNAGGVIFVEQQNGVPAPPTGVYVPNVQTPGSTEITFELDVPAVDNIMGWEYELDFIPGTTGTATAVQDSAGATTFYVPRLSASPSGERLQFTKALADLNCKVGTGAYAPCTGGKFQLKNLKALSWFTATTPAGITADDAASRATVAKSDGKFTRQSVQFGSPLAEAAAQWDAVFYVGSPAAPSGIRVPDVALAASDLQIYLAAPVDDLAYAYTFTINRIQADGTSDTAKIVTVHQDKRALQQSEFVLTIDTGSLNGAGRYQLTAATAISWFNTADVSASLAAPIVFIYGRPSESSAPVISAVPNEPTGTTLHVAIDPPAADVARYYTVAVEYHSSKAVSGTLSAAETAVVDLAASCSTTGKEALTALQRTAQKGASLVVRCPATTCASESAAVYNDGAYLFTSSICRAAVHAGVITDGAGGSVALTLGPGANLPRTFTDTSAKHNVQTAALSNFDTAADNWDMAFTEATGLPTTTTFTVMRWGGTARDASIKTIGNVPKLVLPIELSDSFMCGDEGTSQCGNGKYLVKSVTAHPWTGTGSLPSTPDRTAFTFVGTPDAPSDIRAPSVVLATSPLHIYIAAPAEDLAQSYAVTLERLPAGTADGSGTPVSIEVPRTAVTLVDSEGTPEYQLAVLASDLQTKLGEGVAVAGRYRLYDLKAVSWFDTQQAPSRTPATFTPIHFVIGSPSDSSASVEVSAADNKLSGTVLDVAIPSPDVDVAKYYLVQVSYFIGDAETVLQTNTFSCATTAKGTFAGQTPAAGTSLVVNCPSNCAGAAPKVYTSAASEYLFTSSVCRAAIHAGVITNSGGPVQLTLKAGSGTSRTWSQSTNQDVQSEAGSETISGNDNWDMTLQALTPAPTTTAFIVPRWGGSAGLVAKIQGTGTGAKLVLPVDLSQAICRTENSNSVPCGDGKYLVKSVTAMPWHENSKYTPPATGSKASRAHTLFTFIGDPEEPLSVAGVSSTELNKLSISFTLPKADTAAKYVVQAQKFFPGNQPADTCGAEIDLPSNAVDTLPASVVDSGGLRTVTITCTHTPGKFKVIQFQAGSRQSGGSDQNADLTTAAYFYIGTVGSITSVSSPSIPIEAGTPSAVSSLEVLWRQTSPDPAKTASYSLSLWPTGASTASSPCTVNLIESQMDAVVYQGGDSTKPLRLPSAPLCNSVTNLAKGRYTIEWTVQGWTATGADLDTNQATRTSDYFYIGDPEAPGAPTLANDAAQSKLKVTFTTPSVDNAAGYKYDLVKLANPSVNVPVGTNSGGDLATDGYTFVEEKSDVPTAGLGAASSTFEHALAVADASALYAVRVWSYNDNDQTGKASGWSAAIGTGNIAGTSPSSVIVVDGEDKLTVTFKLVAGALGYEYTVYRGNDQGAGVSGHTDVAVTVSSWSIAGNTATFDISADANIQKGRYMVAVRPTNYRLVDDASTLTVGSYTYSAVAAVGTPGEPTVTLANTPGQFGLVDGSVTVMFTKPSPDSGLQYWYALYKADTDQACYTSLGTKVASSNDLLTATEKSFILSSLESGDYQVRVGVSNGVTTGSTSVAATPCSSQDTFTTLSTNVKWSALSAETIAVANPAQPGQPTVVYNHGQNKLLVTFRAPATARSYTYKVLDTTDSNAQVTTGSDNILPNRPSEDVTFEISTNPSNVPWGPGLYMVTVYAQNAYTTGDGIQSPASAGTYVGTPAPVTAKSVKLENTFDAQGKPTSTITVKYTPPGVDIAYDAPGSIGENTPAAGNYRYNIQSRLADCTWSAPAWADLTKKPTCTAGVCSFDITVASDGMYKVEVAARMQYAQPSPGTGNDEAVGTAVSSTDTGDHTVGEITYMRSGIVAVGTPGIPQVSLTGAVDGMTISVTGIATNGNANALQYRWVYLKDAATESPPSEMTTLKPAPIPLTAESSMGGIDPLACNPAGIFPVQSKVNLDAMRCGAGRASACEAGTYRVAVIAVNGAGTSALVAGDLTGSVIMGPPSKPVVDSLVVMPDTMDSLIATWQMPNTYTATSYSYRIWNTLDNLEAEYTDDSLDSNQMTTFQQTVNGMGLYKVTVTATNSYTSTPSDATPDNGLVVGFPIAGGTLGLREVSAARKVDVQNPNTKELSINFKDGLNSWFGEANCETTYEWELVQWPGLELAASSSQTINPCGNSACTGSGDDRGCSGIVADIASLADGRYQVFVLAFNKYGYTRSEGSNAFTVGAPSANPLSITARDGDSKITVSFATPERPGSYQCQGTGADNSDWSPATVTKQLSEVSLSSDGQTTSFDITSTDVGALATTKQRWAVQCKPINDWTTAVGYSAPAYAASGAPVPAGAPTLALAASAVTFNFAPASPDAAITYVFILEDQDGNVHESSPVGFASLAAGAGADAGKKVYTWANAPSGQFKGKVRSVNGVGIATSPESAELVVGTPGTPGKPTALSGQTGFVVTFSPGTPSAATFFKYTIYTAAGTPVVGGAELLADPSTATGATAPSTPTGGTDYKGLTASDRLSFNTGNLAAKTGLALAAGVYKIAVLACNDKLPAASQCSSPSPMSDVVSRGSPGIPKSLVLSTGSLNKLKLVFDVPSPDAASYYEYSVRDASNLALIPTAIRKRVELDDLDKSVPTKLSFETVALDAYKAYDLRLTAVGYGSVYSSWSTPSAVAGMLGAPTAVSVAPGADKLTVSFTADALLLDTDTFAYKISALGATTVAVGDANGYLVPRASFAEDLAAAGQKSFTIALGAVGQLTAPAGGYYVEVMAARPLASGGFEAGAVSSQAGPAALGAPSALAAAPRIVAVTSDGSPKATVEWDYADQYSTYTKVDWQIKDGATVAASGSVNRAGAITAAVSSPLSIDIPLNTGGANKDQSLAGRFTIELSMANAQANSAWSTASAIFAAGTATAPATVTIAGGTSSMTGTFTLPATPVYDTLAYRLVSVGQDGTGTSLLFGDNSWKELSSAEIDAKTFTITDPVVVGGTSYPVPTGRYRLDMRAAANNGATPADYIGSTASQTPAYKGVPAAVVTVSATSQRDGDNFYINIAFPGVEFATGYKVHVLDSSGAAVMSGDTAVVTVLPDTIKGSGAHSYSLQAGELGGPTGAATFKFKVESTNPNTGSGTGALSPESILAIFGKLATPTKPALVWVDQAGSDPAHAELRFIAITVPAGASPSYEYQLYDATQQAVTAVGTWQAIDLAQATLDGSTYKLRLAPSPGKYTVTMRANTALGASARSDESEHSAAEVTGVTSEPSFATIVPGTDIDTAGDGATTVTLHVTLPSSNIGTDQPQLQLRMDTVEPTEVTGVIWADVAASCDADPAGPCIAAGDGTSGSPHQVRVKLTAAPRRVKFVARTSNDNGAGAESGPSNTISVGRPIAPAVTATGSASGVEVSFTPDAASLLTTDTFRYWAVGSDGTTERLADAGVGAVTVGAGGKRTFSVPLSAFGGTYIVTLKIVAVNANGVRSADAAASSVTVGPVNKPTQVTATPAVTSGSATVAVEWLPGDATATKYDIKAYSEKDAVMTFGTTGAVVNGDKLRKELSVGGGVGQLPPGLWKFAVVAENANSQAMSDQTAVAVPAGVPGAPVVMAVSATPNSNDAAITFTLAGDNLAEQVRASYAPAGADTWTELPAAAIPENRQITLTSLPTGIWRFRLEAGNTVTGAWSTASNVWPAVTVGLPGKPTIHSATGSKDIITLVVEQAADATATSFELAVFDASGAGVTPTYNAPLLSVGSRSNGRQTVVFATDNTKLGGTYRFKATAVSSVGKSLASEMTDTAVAAYQPAAPTGLSAVGGANKATLTFTPPAGAVWYEATIQAAGSWQVPTATSLALYAPCPLSAPISGCTALSLGSGTVAFDVPLAALGNRDGDYAFKVRAVDANSVAGDWSSASSAVTVGAPDAPTALAATAEFNTNTVDLSFVPAWLAEQGYEIEVLDKDGNAVKDANNNPVTLTVSASTCTAKPAAPQ